MIVVDPTVLRQTPLHSWHVAAGAKMADFGGFEMPIEYPSSGVLKEHAAVRESVGLFDVSHLGKVRVAGPKARQFLNAVLSNDLQRIDSGGAQYTLLCDDVSGGVIDDLIAYVLADDEVLLVPNAANSAEVVRQLTARADDRIDVRDEHLDLAVIAVQGPRSADILDSLGLPTQDPYMRFTVADHTGSPVIVCRSGYTGEHGYELLPSWDEALSLWESLAEAVRNVGGLPAGLGARDTLRTEMGYPLHGQDLSPSITPVQARLGWAVGWDKPQFCGRSVLLAERAAGPSKVLRGLLATDRGIPRPHMTVTDADGNTVGEVTSGTFSPTLRQGIGLALLDAPVSEGQDVTVDVRGRKSVMTVVRPPFVKSSTAS